MVAAGNGGMGIGGPVVDISPANSPEAITVGAIYVSWRVAEFSNFGKRPVADRVPVLMSADAG